MTERKRLLLINRIDLATCYLLKTDPVRIEALEAAMNVAVFRDHKACQGLLRTRDMLAERNHHNRVESIEKIFTDLAGKKLAEELLSDSKGGDMR